MEKEQRKSNYKSPNCSPIPQQTRTRTSSVPLSTNTGYQSPPLSPKCGTQRPVLTDTQSECIADINRARSIVVPLQMIRIHSASEQCEHQETPQPSLKLNECSSEPETINIVDSPKSNSIPIFAPSILQINSASEVVVAAENKCKNNEQIMISHSYNINDIATRPRGQSL
eukprot:340507_1